MEDEIFPRYYDAWKICITKKCKIELTKKYVNDRIADLSDMSSPGRKAFEKKYGSHWTETILGYFKQALTDPELQ